MKRKIYWLGCDCGQKEHHVVLLSEEGEKLLDRRVKNRFDSLSSTLEEVKGICEEGECRVVLESIRSVGMLLAGMAREADMDLWHVPPKALDSFRQVEGQPRKTDRIDAYLLARMGVLNAGRCNPVSEPTPEESALSRLARLRKRLVDARKAWGERLRATILELCPDVLNLCDVRSKTFRAVSRVWPGLEGLERAQVRKITSIVFRVSRGRKGSDFARDLRKYAGTIACRGDLRSAITTEVTTYVEALDSLDESIGNIEKQIKGLVSNHPKGEAIMEMEGISFTTAAFILGEIAPMARFMSEPACATYSGVTPLSRDSGKTQGKSRLARGVNKYVLNALYLSSVSAVNFSPVCRKYFEKKKKGYAGHKVPHIKAGLALARQRHKVIYRILTTDERYDRDRLVRTHCERWKIKSIDVA